MNTEQLRLLLEPLQAKREEGEATPKPSQAPPHSRGPAPKANPPWQGDSDAGLILPLILILMTDGNNFGLILALLYILM